jgi:hypothetical protein
VPDDAATQKRGGGRAGRVAARIGLVVFSLALGAGLVEFAVRAALDVYRCDERMGWTFQSDRTGFKLNRPTRSINTVRLNRHGFRGPDRDLDKPRDVYRTLILGDSFTAGLHIAEEDSYPARLEASLNAKSAAGKRFEIINTGVPGYSTAQELALFREIGWRHQPDFVVLAVYLGNDISNNSIRAVPCHYLVSLCGRPFYEMRDGRLVAVADGKPQRVAPKGFLDRVFGFSLVYRNLIQRSREPVSEAAPEAQIVYGIESGARGIPSWVTTMELILQIRKSVEVYGIPFAVLIVSTQPEIVTTPITPAFRLYRKRFVAFLERQGIQYIDTLAPLLRNQDAGRHPYYATDHHWNETGHEIAAESVDAFFVEHCGALGAPIEDCPARLPQDAAPR